MALTLVLLQIAQFLILVFGLVIVYFGSKSYRRTKSKSMLLLSIGFAVVSVGSVLGGVAFQLMGADLQTASTIEAWAQAIGFLIIILSLAAVKD